jgi:hypothetical protein
MLMFVCIWYRAQGKLITKKERRKVRGKRRGIESRAMFQTGKIKILFIV